MRPKDMTADEARFLAYVQGEAERLAEKRDPQRKRDYRRDTVLQALDSLVTVTTRIQFLDGRKRF